MAESLATLASRNVAPPFCVDMALSSARSVVAFSLGEDVVGHLTDQAPEVMEHGYRVGGLMRHMLETAGCGVTSELAEVMGGTHDLGKIVNPAVLAATRSSEKFSDEQRQWVTKTHSLDGADYIIRLREASNNPLLWFAGFGAFFHHQAVRQPNGDPEDRVDLANGLTNLLQVCDVLDALQDHKRTYRDNRNGRPMTAALAYEIVTRNRPRMLRIAGVAIDIHTQVAEILGFDPQELDVQR